MLYILKLLEPSYFNQFNANFYAKKCPIAKPIKLINKYYFFNLLYNILIVFKSKRFLRGCAQKKSYKNLRSPEIKINFKD